MDAVHYGCLEKLHFDCMDLSYDRMSSGIHQFHPFGSVSDGLAMVLGIFDYQGHYQNDFSHKGVKRESRLVRLVVVQ